MSTKKTIIHNYDSPPTLEMALEESKVDTSIWKVDNYTINRWQMGRKAETKELSFDGHGPRGFISDTGDITKKWLYQIKVNLVRKKEIHKTVEDMLESIAKGAPAVKKIKRSKVTKPSDKNMLEVSIMDLHLGMMCFEGSSDGSWSIEEASDKFLAAIDRLLFLSKPYNIEKILFPIGNDFLHAEFTHATTKGTPQPESVDERLTFEAGKDLLITAIDNLKKIAPVHVLSVPGNHAENAEIHMSHVIHAWYRNDDNVLVEHGPEPYRFIKYGCSLIGFEHGNNIPPTRLRSLMPVEVPELWSSTRFHEWHLGDKHRKGVSPLVVFEEFGIGIEYIPSLVPCNQWHKQNAFSHQQRGAVAYLWNYEEGPLAKFHTSL